MQNLGTN